MKKKAASLVCAVLTAAVLLASPVLSETETAAASSETESVSSSSDAGTAENVPDTAGEDSTEKKESGSSGKLEAEAELLVVSFGTSYNSSRTITIGGIENALREAFPNFLVRRAFSSDSIIDKIAEYDPPVKVDTVESALDRAVSEGIRYMIVQPTHLMAGYEYEDLIEDLEKYSDKFDKLVLGEPLFSTDADFTAVAEAIHAATEQYDDGKTAIVFMGHGTEAKSNEDYQLMQDKLKSLGYENYYIGTVEAEPSCDDVLAAIADKGYEKVVLRDLMVVAGDHAENDMADAENPESWYSRFTAAGYDVTVVLEGLGQIYDIEQLYVRHAARAAKAVSLSADQSFPAAVISDGDPEKEVLVVSLGTGYNDTRNITIGGIENALREAYPDYQIRRAFTSPFIIDSLAERDGIITDSLEKALDRAADEGVKELIVQPALLTEGIEFDKIKDLTDTYADRFDSLKLAEPLMTSEEDYTAVAEALHTATKRYNDGNTAIVYVAHGTEDSRQALRGEFNRIGYIHYYVARAGAEEACESLISGMAWHPYTRVILLDLAVAAGEFAHTDLSDPENPESWYSKIKEAGYEVMPVMHGLGQIYDIQKLYVERTAGAMAAGQEDVE